MIVVLDGVVSEQLTEYVVLSSRPKRAGRCQIPCSVLEHVSDQMNLANADSIDFAACVNVTEDLGVL